MTIPLSACNQNYDLRISAPCRWAAQKATLAVEGYVNVNDPTALAQAASELAAGTSGQANLQADGLVTSAVLNQSVANCEDTFFNASVCQEYLFLNVSNPSTLVSSQLQSTIVNANCTILSQLATSTLPYLNTSQCASQMLSILNSYFNGSVCIENGYVTGTNLTALISTAFATANASDSNATLASILSNFSFVQYAEVISCQDGYFNATVCIDNGYFSPQSISGAEAIASAAYNNGDGCTTLELLSASVLAKLPSCTTVYGATLMTLCILTNGYVGATDLSTLISTAFTLANKTDSPTRLNGVLGAYGYMNLGDIAKLLIFASQQNLTDWGPDATANITTSATELGYNLTLIEEEVVTALQGSFTQANTTFVEAASVACLQAATEVLNGAKVECAYTVTVQQNIGNCSCSSPNSLSPSCTNSCAGTLCLSPADSYGLYDLKCC